MSPASLVELIRDVDTHIHAIAARRAVKKVPVGITLKQWDKMYNTLLCFAGTKKAKKLIEYTKD